MKCDKHDECMIMRCWICGNERSFLEMLFDKKTDEPKGTMTHEYTFTTTPLAPDPPIKFDLNFV